MPEHVTRSTEYVTKWCDHCRRHTQHSCSDARVGRCVEDHRPRKTAKLSIGARVTWKGFVADRSAAAIGGTVVNVMPNTITIRWDDGLEGDFIQPAGDSELWALAQQGKLDAIRDLQ
jgi:hypothetical protein